MHEHTSGAALIDVGLDLREDIHSIMAYNEEHMEDLVAYIEERYPPESFEGHLLYLLQNPYLCRTVIENFNLPDAVKWQMWIDALSAPKPKMRIIYFLGDIGSGKTTLAYDMAHSVHEQSGRAVFSLGDPTSLPDFIQPLGRLKDAPRRSLIVMDEAAANAGSRTSQNREQRSLPPELATIRHDDHLLFVISQHSGMADTTFTRLASAFVLKPLGLTQGMTERGAIRRFLARYGELLPRHPQQCLIHSRHLPPLTMMRDVPEWYSDDLSTAYRRIDSDEQAMLMAKKLRARRVSWAVLSSKMASRWKLYSAEWWRQNLPAWNEGVDPAEEAGAPARARA